MGAQGQGSAASTSATPSVQVAVWPVSSFADATAYHRGLLAMSTNDPWVWAKVECGSWSLVSSPHAVGLLTEWGSVKSVFVDPAHRRQGEATQVLRTAMSLGGYWLEVAEGNVAAIAVYVKLGFRPTTRDVFPGFLLMELRDCRRAYNAFVEAYRLEHAS